MLTNSQIDQVITNLKEFYRVTLSEIIYLYTEDGAQPRKDIDPTSFETAKKNTENRYIQVRNLLNQMKIICNTNADTLAALQDKNATAINENIMFKKMHKQQMKRATANTEMMFEKMYAEKVKNEKKLEDRIAKLERLQMHSLSCIEQQLNVADQPNQDYIFETVKICLKQMDQYMNQYIELTNLDRDHVSAFLDFKKIIKEQAKKILQLQSTTELEPFEQFLNKFSASESPSPTTVISKKDEELAKKDMEIQTLQHMLNEARDEAAQEKQRALKQGDEIKELDSKLKEKDLEILNNNVKHHEMMDGMKQEFNLYKLSITEYLENLKQAESRPRLVSISSASSYEYSPDLNTINTNNNYIYGNHMPTMLFLKLNTNDNNPNSVNNLTSPQPAAKRARNEL